MVLIERKHPSAVVPLGLFAGRKQFTPFLALMLVPGGMFAFFYFIALFTQQVLHYSPLMSGLSLLPFSAMILVTSQLAPRLLAKIGERVAGTIGIALLFIAFLWLSRLSENSTFVNGILGPTLILGLGAGLSFATLTAVALDRAPRQYMSAASSLVQAMQQLGGSIGVSVLTTVFVAVSAANGEDQGIASAFIGGAVFLLLALVLFALWGSRVGAAESEGASAPANA